ncbi:uncharacterized protein N7511_011442 [Penicillium nucicola]|uniref:uncharacterized protein n=1 Tax=Penicillium nucicola TaxID=1850975 RepID=UPI00254599A4|nr:uncharacterized protein N7511_011442 [Penicillium nucicola]KAJ5742423.1 hypothetical protein N7511_011442 [Penicillium nucicola]
MPNLKAKAKTPKPRTKTFTGCWTCRDRRVKCGDEHPHCRRCQRSGLHCGGYGLRLGWSPTPGGRSHRRQVKPLTHDGGNGMSPVAVTALLNELESCAGVGRGQQRGPFSVFSVSDVCDASQPLSSIQRETDQPKPDLRLAASLAAEENNMRSSGANWNSSSTTISVTSEGEIPDATTDPVAQGGDEPLTSIETLVNHHRVSSPVLDSTIPNKAPSKISANDFAPLQKSLNPLALPRPETELLHHWVVFLSGNMLLIDKPDNPCRAVFMPMALKGLDASPAESNIHLSIFHAICASSAFSLYHIRHDQRYHSLAMHHDQLALRHLRRKLQQAQRIDETTLAAVLTCITSEAMSGRRSRWRTHVVGCLGLLENEFYGDWIRTPIASRLLQSYLSLSSLCSLPVSERLMSLLNGPSEFRHNLERSHGITTPLVQFIAQITALAESKVRLSLEELDQIEMQLYLNFPSLSNPNAPESRIIQHALNSFYYATIVYFRRTLRRAPLCEVQDLIEKAIEDLEAVDTLTRGNGGCSYNWGSFVVAADCERPDLQDRMLVYFDGKSRHGIQNINSLCEIIQVLWDRRTAAGPHVDIHWQELAKEADYDIMLV